MKFKVLFAVALGIAVSAPAQAKDEGNSEQKEAPKEKKICRTSTVTGSLVAKRRTCMTQAKWDELAANTRQHLSEMDRRQNIGSETGSGSGSNNNAGFGF